MRGIRVLALAAALGILHSGAMAQAEPLRLAFSPSRPARSPPAARRWNRASCCSSRSATYTLAGRKVELFVGDTGGNPAQAKTRTQELVERNAVHVIIGPLATSRRSPSTTTSGRPRSPRHADFRRAEGPGAAEAQRLRIHAVGNAAQPMHVLGEFAARQSASSASHRGRRLHLRPRRRGGLPERLRGERRPRRAEAVAAAQRARVQRLCQPDQAGRRRRLRRVRRHQRPALPQAVREFGFKRIPGFGNPTCVDEGVLRNMGDEALACIRRAGTRRRSRPPRTGASCRRSSRSTRWFPGFYTAGTYVSGLYLESALNAVKGRFEDKPLRPPPCTTCAWSAADGPIRIDEYGKPVLNIYVRRSSARTAACELHRRHLPRGDPVLELRPAKFLAAPGYRATTLPPTISSKRN